MEDNARIIDKLRKVLALTNSPIEGEATAAAEHLQRLLLSYNLSIADLEQRGAAAKPGVREVGHDLGKAAFKWKLNLAEVIAEHYFCLPLVDHVQKTVKFVGRPDNVESLTMLYAWVIDQIKRISAEERRVHFIRTNEHVDPLRWQVNFGLGIVSRMGRRLEELRKRQAEDVQTQALVVSHTREVNDYLEAKYGYRRDGIPTKRQREAQEEWERYLRRREEEEAARVAALTPEQREAERLAKEREEKEAARAAEKRRKQWERNAARRTGRTRYLSPEAERKEEQAWHARQRGRESADRVNLQPFITGQTDKTKVKE